MLGDNQGVGYDGQPFTYDGSPGQLVDVSSAAMRRHQLCDAALHSARPMRALYAAGKRPPSVSAPQVVSALPFWTLNGRLVKGNRWVSASTNATARGRWDLASRLSTAWQENA